MDHYFLDTQYVKYTVSGVNSKILLEVGAGEGGGGGGRLVYAMHPHGEQPHAAYWVSQSLPQICTASALVQIRGLLKQM